MRSRRSKFGLSSALALAVLSLSPATLRAQSTSSADPKSVPVIDGGIGPCSADFTITDGAGAPIYAATVRVHIAYGFMNAHKLDLEVGTNAAGKARFTGLPEKTKQGLSSWPPKVPGRDPPSTTPPRPARRTSPSLSTKNRPQNKHYPLCPPVF